MSPIVGHPPSRPVRRQDRAALWLVHRRASGPDRSFRENVIGIQRQCISIGHGGRINLNNQWFKSNRSGSRCRFELVSMLRRVSAGSIKSKLLHNVWNRQFFNPIDLNPLKPSLSRYSQKERPYGSNDYLFISENTVPNIQYPDHLTLCVCQMAIVLWSNRVETVNI